MARILVIDPDACLRNLLREVLEHEGYDVVEAHNGYEGLQHYQTEPVDRANTVDQANTDVMYLVAF